MSVQATLEAEGLTFAANLLETNKAEVETELGAGVKLLVDDGTKLVEGADAKLGPLAAGVINTAIATYGPIAEADAATFEGSGIDAVAAWLKAEAAKLAPPAAA